LAMGESEEEAEDALFAALSVKASRFALSDKLKQILVPYLLTELELKTLSDVESLGAKGFEEALDEAAEGKKIPAPLRSGALEWFAHLGDDTGQRVRSGKEKPPTRRVGVTRKARIAPIEPDTDDDDDAMSIVSGLGGFGSDKQSKDEEKMRLSGDEIQALHRSVFKGRVVSASECEGVPYGQDCQYTEWARLLKKSGIVTYLKHLDDKDYGKAKEKLITLIREYNEKGFTQEVTILTGAMTSAEEMFVGDEKGLCSYWEAYWKLYQGRAFPKEIDLRLVVKSLKVGQSQGLQKSLTSVEEDVKRLGELKAKLEKLDSKVNTIEQKTNTNTSKLSNMRIGGGGGGSGDRAAGGPKCSYCQESGHFWRNCPKRLAEEEAEASGEEDKSEDKSAKGKKK
jgi:hypothetical protein